MRLRHAFLQSNHFVVGQTWSTFSDPEDKLVWNPVPFMDIVVEFLGGARISMNGERATSSQIQTGWTLRI